MLYTEHWDMLKTGQCQVPAKMKLPGGIEIIVYNSRPKKDNLRYKSVYFHLHGVAFYFGVAEWGSLTKAVTAARAYRDLVTGDFEARYECAQEFFLLPYPAFDRMEFLVSKRVR